MMASGSDGWARAKAVPTSGSWAIREEEGFGLNQLFVYALRRQTICIRRGGFRSLDLRAAAGKDPIWINHPLVHRVLLFAAALVV